MCFYWLGRKNKNELEKDSKKYIMNKFNFLCVAGFEFKYDSVNAEEGFFYTKDLISISVGYEPSFSKKQSDYVGLSVVYKKAIYCCKYFSINEEPLLKGEFSEEYFSSLKSIEKVDYLAKIIENNLSKLTDNEYINSKIKEIEKNYKNHSLNLQSKFFNLIKSGEKKYEIRLFDEKRKTFNLGDTITFYNQSKIEESFKAQIVWVSLYKNFKSMLKALNKKDLGFNGCTKKEILETFNEFYSKEQQKKYLVVVFKLNII